MLLGEIFIRNRSVILWRCAMQHQQWPLWGYALLRRWRCMRGVYEGKKSLNFEFWRLHPDHICCDIWKNVGWSEQMIKMASWENAVILIKRLNQMMAFLCVTYASHQDRRGTCNQWHENGKYYDIPIIFRILPWLCSGVSMVFTSYASTLLRSDSKNLLRSPRLKLLCTSRCGLK